MKTMPPTAKPIALDRKATEPAFRERFVGSYAPIPKDLRGDCLATASVDEIEDLFPEAIIPQRRPGEAHPWRDAARRGQQRKRNREP